MSSHYGNVGTGIAGALTPDEGFSQRPALPGPSLSAVLAIGIELLPTIEDGLLADLVEHLLFALVERDETLLAVRSVLSNALKHAHGLHEENVRLRRRLAELLDARRGEARAK